MTQHTAAMREVAQARLPELEAVTAALGEQLAALLSPSVVAALRTPSGADAPAPELALDQNLPSRASGLVRDLDAMLPELRAAGAVK